MRYQNVTYSPSCADVQRPGRSAGCACRSRSARRRGGRGRRTSSGWVLTDWETRSGTDGGVVDLPGPRRRARAAWQVPVPHRDLPPPGAAGPGDDRLMWACTTSRCGSADRLWAPCSPSWARSTPSGGSPCWFCRTAVRRCRPRRHHTRPLAGFRPPGKHDGAHGGLRVAAARGSGGGCRRRPGAVCGPAFGPEQRSPGSQECGYSRGILR